MAKNRNCRSVEWNIPLASTLISPKRFSNGTRILEDNPFPHQELSGESSNWVEILELTETLNNTARKDLFLQNLMIEYCRGMSKVQNLLFRKIPSDLIL